MGVGDQGGCEPKMKLLLKCKKSWGMGGGGSSRGGVQDGCKPRTGVITKMQKKSRDAMGWKSGRGGIRVDMNQELKLL